METDALRKQLYEEIQTEFDAKLKESRRQKYQLEEEFEQSSEKWRIERRRLNAEIDRLESALAEARQPGREPARSNPSPIIDPQEAAMLQTAGEKKLNEASQAWEKERARLLAEVSRLEESILEVLERSNNPLRSNQNERQKMDSRYDDAVRAKHVAEEALVAAKGEWEKEKLSLVSEAMKHRGSSVQTNEPGKGDEPQRLRLAADLEKARQELSKLKEAHSAEIRDVKVRLDKSSTEIIVLKASLDDARTSAGQERATLEQKLRNSEDSRVRMERELENAKQTAETVRLKEELDEAQNVVRQLQRQLAETGGSTNSDIVDNLRRQYERRIQDVIQENNQLSEKVKNATALLEEEGYSGVPVSAIDSPVIDAEIARINARLAEIGKIIEDPETELSTVIRKNVERAELDAYLKGMLFSLGRGRAL